MLKIIQGDPGVQICAIHRLVSRDVPTTLPTNQPTNQPINQPTNQPTNPLVSNCGFQTSLDSSPRFFLPSDGKPLKKTRRKQEKNSYLKMLTPVKCCKENKCTSPNLPSHKSDIKASNRKYFIAGFHPQQPQTSP